jgi:tripeptide aminopeptidase
LALALAITRLGWLGLPGDVWLVANVGEEGLGDLRGMRAVVDRFGENVCAYLILEGMALGQIYYRGLGVQRYRITVNTTGGHSWVDYGKPSAIHELGNLIGRLAALEVPVQPRSSLNVGVIAGGTSVNTIAPEAHLELDLRSENGVALSQLVHQVETLVSTANRPDVEVSLELIGRRPAGKLPSSHPLVRLAKRCLQAQGIPPNLTIGSTDANVPLSRGFPSICIGLSTGYGAHTANEYVHVGPLFQGLAQMVALVEGIFQELCN